MINIKSERELDLMRKAGALAAKTLDYISEYVVPGVDTEKLDQMCHDFIISHGAYPAPLNYMGFPKSTCTSLNEVICHGIPSKKDVLKSGDILNIDVTVILDGFHGDTNRTFLVGEVSQKAKKLVDVTYECLMAGIKEVAPGKHLGDIGAAIQEIAHSHNYSVVEDFCGHGIGRDFHEEPQVLHFGKKGKGLILKEGMTFTIEPMINLGVKQAKVLKDGWTAITKDRKLSAQFEHTLAVTKDGYEIFTLSQDNK